MLAQTRSRAHLWELLDAVYGIQAVDTGTRNSGPFPERYEVFFGCTETHAG